MFGSYHHGLFVSSRHERSACQVVGFSQQPSGALIDCGDHAIGPKHLCVQQRLNNGHGAADQQTVAIDAGTGHAIQSLGDVDPFDFQFRVASRLDF